MSLSTARKRGGSLFALGGEERVDFVAELVVNLLPAQLHIIGLALGEGFVNVGHGAYLDWLHILDGGGGDIGGLGFIDNANLIDKAVEDIRPLNLI